MRRSNRANESTPDDPCRPCIICGPTSRCRLFEKNGYKLVKCSSCGLVYVADPPSQIELEKLYSFETGYHKKFADEQAAVQFDLSSAKKHFDLIPRSRKPGRILDIGCSAGLFLNHARENGWEAFGIELSPDTSEIARKKYGLNVHTGRLEKNTFEPESFDVVTMWDVIEHLEDPTSVLSMVRDILKPGAILLFETPNIDGLFPRISYKIANAVNYWPHPEPPGHLFQFSKQTVEQLLVLSGFEIVAVHDHHIPYGYSFGSLAANFTSPKRLLYSATFAPLAFIGPLVGSGDSIIVVARKCL